MNKRQIKRDAVLNFHLFRLIYAMKSAFLKTCERYRAMSPFLVLHIYEILSNMNLTIAFPLKLKKSGYSLYQQIKIRAEC